MVKMYSSSNNKFLEKRVIKKQIKLPAVNSNWVKVYKFLKYFTTLLKISEKNTFKILLASEEIFVNVSRYAYPKTVGDIKISVEYLKDLGIIRILFEDQGIPFNPLLVKKPQINVSPSKRKIGGLGIFMVRKMVDEIEYEYFEGKNKLLITKNLDNN